MAEEQPFSFFGENRSLFSDYYLKERLGDRREWNEDIGRHFKKTKDLYEKIKNRLPTLNESQAEAQFFRRILREILGWSYDV
jgi:hypothetical protein